MRSLLTFLICSALLLGCSSTRRETGDFTGFLRQQLIARGAGVPTELPLPAIRGTWTYGPTEFGDFQILLYEHKIEEIDELLTAALGEPQRKRDAHSGLEALRIYHKKRVGVSLFIVGKEKGVWIGIPNSQ
jgi:hypothetical protein